MLNLWSLSVVTLFLKVNDHQRSPGDRKTFVVPKRSGRAGNLLVNDPAGVLDQPDFNARRENCHQN